MTKNKKLTYAQIKKKILKDGRFLRGNEETVLETWFWAGVKAATQVTDKLEKLVKTETEEE